VPPVWAFVAGAHRGIGPGWEARNVGATNGYGLTGAALELVAESPLDVAAWAQCAGAAPLVLCGHSLGGPKVVLAAVSGVGVARWPALCCWPGDMARYTQALPGLDRMKDKAERFEVTGNGRQLLESS